MPLIEFCQKFFIKHNKKLLVLHDGCGGFATQENAHYRQWLSQWAVLVTHPPNSPCINAQEFCWAEMVRLKKAKAPTFNIKDVRRIIPDLFRQATTPEKRAGYFRHMLNNCRLIIEWNGSNHPPE